MLKKVTKEQLREYLHEFFDTYNIPGIFRWQYEELYLDGYYGRVVDSQIIQFYKEYDLIKEEYDSYKAFVDIVKYSHPDIKDMTILELGGGMIPQLGRELAKEAKHVIVVDKNMVFRNNPNNLEPIRQRVESYKELPTADMIIGLLPCETTKHIIDYSVCNKKDFLIALCGCYHDLILDENMAMRINPRNEPYKNHELYEKYALLKMEEAQELGNIMIYDSPYQFPYDVIGNKRR